MSTPYSPVDMVKAVAYLFGRMQGDESPPRSLCLEVFDVAPDETAPEIA